MDQGIWWFLKSSQWTTHYWWSHPNVLSLVSRSIPIPHLLVALQLSRSINSKDKAENEFSLEKKLALGSQRCLWTCSSPSASLKESFPNPCSPSVCALMHHPQNTLDSGLCCRVSPREHLRQGSSWETGEWLGECLGSSISCPHWIPTPSRVVALWVKLKQQLYNHRATSEHSEPALMAISILEGISQEHTQIYF